MKIPKIVAPGGSYQKAMVASKYGADEVYVGVPFTSLRMRQNKIKTFSDLKKTIKDLHLNGTKALLTMNIFPRNQDIKIFESTVEQIADVGADAIIFSDPGTFTIIRKYLPKIPLHLSTQTSTMNYDAVRFRYDLGIARIVLARELHINEIKEIKKKVPKIELEVFVHGAMCMSYSGRCLLGDYLSGRPGNKGECTNACRFKYKVWIEEERREGKLFQLGEDENGSYILSSKDLCTINRLAEIIPYVDAMKIEGRSKSEFYVGTIVKAYKHVRDSILTNKKADPKIIDLVNKIPHRQYWDGFLFNDLQGFPEGEVRGEEKNEVRGEEKNEVRGEEKKVDDKFTYNIIGIAMKVHDALGPSLLEKVYKKGLVYELKKNGYNVQEEIKIDYKIDNEVIGTGYIDLIINNEIAIELKSTKIIKGDYYKQLKSYMKNNKSIKTGLLLNFYNKKLGVKRLSSSYEFGLHSHQISSENSHQSSSTTLTSAGPLFNRNYFGTFSDKFIQHNGKKYFQIDPKEVIKIGMKIKFISPTKMSELKIIDILDSKLKKVEGVHCNDRNVYILTDQKLNGWEILYE
ncbi:MAG: GxxExxY protein [Candidatus Absconditabacterales bacterium]